MFAPRRPSKPSDDKRPPVSPQPKISLFDGLRKAFTIKKPSSPAPEFTILEDDPTDVPYIRPVTRTRIPSSVINSAIQSPFQQNIFASIHAVPTARLRRPSNLSFVSVEDAGTTSPTPSLGSLEDDDVDYFDEVEEIDDEKWTRRTTKDAIDVDLRLFGLPPY
ncbi:hypothetical protein BCR33DRAFT_324885 [Rhizoclosmatium globosum]|uniref:Uncharacterized protein n=1 Tax=Rhizoclosmatium globosum TaxID=329046 RepID=A0A1Y2D237_9FUNG|nr:hypothetical protein BCR33DRAFT_324885 [Rhizoclosmatium globosum]|eukprot:ORY52645.1 hypothetical protein BCR33DRAFT_324885 [Rhizoclosmatium globosum]